MGTRKGEKSPRAEEAGVTGPGGQERRASGVLTPEAFESFRKNSNQFVQEGKLIPDPMKGVKTPRR